MAGKWMKVISKSPWWCKYKRVCVCVWMSDFACVIFPHHYFNNGRNWNWKNWSTAGWQQPHKTDFRLNKRCPLILQHIILLHAFYDWQALLDLFFYFPSLCLNQKLMASGQFTKSWPREWPLTWRAMSRPLSGMFSRSVLTYSPSIIIQIIIRKSEFISYFSLTSLGEKKLKSVQCNFYLWVNKSKIEYFCLVLVLVVLFWAHCQVHGPAFGWLWQGKGKVFLFVFATSGSLFFR